MDYLLQKNYPLKINRQKTSKSQSIKYNNKPKGKKAQIFKYTPSRTTVGETLTNLGSDLKKYKSTNKACSLNSLPKLDTYLISNTINATVTTNKGPFELFVRNKTSYYKNSDLKDDIINDEQFVEIELLWDELGISDEYQDQFELYLGTINNSESRQKFLMMEKNNLNKIKDALIKFSKEKKNRFKNIELLKQLNNNIKENILIGDKKISKELLKQIIECIKNIILNSVNIVNNFIKVRESMTCFSIEDKINFDKINQNYSFDNNYLLKINSDISFLKYSEIDKIFEKNPTDDTLDTFLTLYNNIKKNENEKISNPLSKDLLNAIDKCRYYIMQDSFLNNIKTKKILKNHKNNTQKINNKYKGYSLMTLSNANTIDYNFNFMDAKIHKLKSELGKDYNNLFMNSNRPNNTNNNKRYNNLIKNQGKKINNIKVERDNSPYKIKNWDNSDLNYKNHNDDDIYNNYDLYKEEKNEEKEENKRNKKYKEEVIHIKDDDILDIEKSNKKDNVKDNKNIIKEEQKTKEEDKIENNGKEKNNFDDDDKIVDIDLS